jgi:hypothetical protein
MKPNYSFQKRQKELEKKKKKAEKLAKKAAGGDQTPDDPSTEGAEEGTGDDEATGADLASDTQATTPPTDTGAPVKP